MLNVRERAIVVGASSGIGEALAKELARRDDKVALVARREERLREIVDEINSTSGEDRACWVKHDVTNREEVPAQFQLLAERLGGIDALYYTAGVMVSVHPDEFNTEKDVRTLEVNTLGAMAWINEAARRFDRLREGRIVAVSSIAGVRGRRGNPAYCTSKAALDTFMESMRNRLVPKNVGVTTIKPGFVDTIMTEHLDDPLWLKSVDSVAQTIADAAAKRKNTVYVPARWRLVAGVVKMIPSVIFRKINI